MAKNLYTLSIDESLQSLATTKNGLEQSDAQKRQKEYGLNILRSVNKIPLWKKLLEPFLDVFVYILILAAIISLFSKEPVDALIIMVILFANAGIFYVQRFSSDRVLDKLKSYDKRTVPVVRNGNPKQLDVSELVPGDIVLIEEGVQVPADGRLIETDQLEVNESSLTGESNPVKKNTTQLKSESPVFAQRNMVFQGTLVSAGRGMFVVSATGNSTELGRIATLIPADREKTEVEKTISSLFTKVVSGVAIIAVAVFALSLLRGTSVSESLRYALSLTVSAIPEGLPLAISVVLIFGARRMAKHHALVRHLRAIEAFGQTGVIITDKTGTLTKNQLALEDTWQPANTKQSAKYYAALSVSAESSTTTTDSVEQALLKLEKEDHTYKQLGLIPFNQALRMSGSYWKSDSETFAVVKGAPESLFKYGNLSSQQQAAFTKQLEHYLKQGHRVLAIGMQKINGKPPEEFQPNNIKVIGLLAFADSIRPEAKPAVETAQSAGIQIIMLTGDHVSTAAHVGLQTGIITDHSQAHLATDEIIESINKDPLQITKNVRVLARVLPEYKYEILKALQKHRVIVMTGDGINDVPALSKASIGVSMGSGTDAAKEASDVILLNDNFASIVSAIERGRAITANIKKMVYYLFSTNVSTIIIILFSLIAGLPLPLLAAQILWINLVADGVAVIPLGLEPAEDDVMKQKAHHLTKGLFTNYDRLRLVVVSGTMAAITLTIFILYRDIAPDKANTIAFSVLTAMQWANALNSRSFHQGLSMHFKKPNFRLYAGIMIAIVLQLIILLTPAGKLLEVVSIGSTEVLLICVAPILIILVDSFYKITAKRHYHDEA